MPRTNVVGATAPPGSGAQRCAQAGEREHRIDSTAGTAATAALPITDRGIGYRLFTAGLIPSMAVQP